MHTMGSPASTHTELRAPTLDDLEPVVELLNAESLRLTGSRDCDVDAIHGWWTQPPPFDLVEDVVLVERDGAIVGYGDVGDQANEGTVFWLDVRGEQFEQLVLELTRRARAKAAPEAVVRATVAAADADGARTLERLGYAPIRSSYKMSMELGGRSFDPSFPAGTAVRSAVEGEDEELLHDLNERTFADHWGFMSTPYAEWLHWLRALGKPDPSLWFVATIDGQHAGLALCRPSESGDPDSGWVSTLGVLPAFRGRGLGTALLQHACAEFQRRGLARAGLGVDAENVSGAVRLYERVGMQVVRKQDTWERPL